MSQSEIHAYLNEIGRYPVLSKETQLLHCRRIQEWVKWPGGRTEAPTRVRRFGEHSMKVMLVTNTRLVVSIAKRYQNKGLDLSDLIQEGNLGLIRALELFDPTRGYAVSTYSYWWIRQSITRALHAHARTIRLPINTHELIIRIQRFIAEHNLLHGCAPTVSDIAEYVAVTPTRVTQVLQAHVMTSCASLDSYVLDDKSPLVDLISSPNESPYDLSPDDALMFSAQREAIEQAFEHLNPAEAHIIRQAFFEGRHLKEIATELGFSRSRAGQIQKTGINKLRLHLASHAREQ